MGGSPSRDAPEAQLEFVYVVKRTDLFPRSTPHGLDVLDAGRRDSLLTCMRERGFFVERRHAETDPSLKQVIPYCVVVRGREVFLMRRLSGGGEARLRGKRSIGVGGHVNPIDEDLAEGEDVIQAGMLRELDEEVRLPPSWTTQAVGLLNDDTTEVGSVHVGLVQVVRVDGEVAVRETDLLEGSFVTLAALKELCRAERSSFETWTALLIDCLDEVLAV